VSISTRAPYRIDVQLVEDLLHLDLTDHRGESTPAMWTFVSTRSTSF
jgi:hypothetical protein